MTAPRSELWWCGACERGQRRRVGLRSPRCKHCGRAGHMHRRRDITRAINARRRSVERDRRAQARENLRAKRRLAELPLEPANDGVPRHKIYDGALAEIDAGVPVWRSTARWHHDTHLAVEVWAHRAVALVYAGIRDKRAGWRIVAACYRAGLAGLLALTYDDEGDPGLARALLAHYPWPLVPDVRAALELEAELPRR